MQAAKPFFRRGFEFKKSELDRPLRECGVQVKHVVAAWVVMCVPAVSAALALVPDVCKLVHARGLSEVDRPKVIPINRSAVPFLSPCSNPDRFGQLTLVCSHDVGEVSERPCCVAVRSDVDVDPAAAGGVALGSCVPELADKLLQELDVLVAEDRGDQFALFVVRAADAAVALEFPFPALCIPGAPGAISVAVAGVFEASRSEKCGGKLGGCAPGYFVHFDLDPNGLGLHVFNLLRCLVFHLYPPRPSGPAVFFCVSIYHSAGEYSKVYLAEIRAI